MATPANSPCAPAIGASETPRMPVTSLSISCSSYMQARKPWPGSRPARADGGPGSRGSIASVLQAAGCTSWCTSRADRNAYRWRSSSATGACSGAPPAARRLRAARRAACAADCCRNVGRDVVLARRSAPSRAAGPRVLENQHVHVLVARERSRRTPVSHMTRFSALSAARSRAPGRSRAPARCSTTLSFSSSTTTARAVMPASGPSWISTP